MDDLFAEKDRRERQLFDHLATRSIVEVKGIVGVDGGSASKTDDQEYWSWEMTFDAWRIGSGSIQKQPMKIRCQASDEEVQILQDLIDPETVIRIHARVAEDNIFGSPQALIEEFIQVDTTDNELNEYLAELQKPVTYEDTRFGTFTFDRRGRSYTANPSWNSTSIFLELVAEKPDDLKSSLKAAYALWDDQASWNKRVQDYAVQKLLPIKNESWLEEDEPELTSEQFKSRMTLESITVYPDGFFDFWHNDGDLFWGHAIQVSGDLLDGPNDADIPG